jgi:NAD(P)H dehydrogenase (quinone)
VPADCRAAKENFMPKYLDATLAVTGAGGHLGRAVIDGLLAAGARHIVAITRDPGKLAGLEARGVEVRAGDFNDAASLSSAFAGVDRLLIISTDAMDDKGTRTAQHLAAIATAETAGVQHIVYTSLTSPYPDPTNPVADSHFWTEARLAASPLTWSSLRNNQYTDYLIPGAQHGIATGQVFHAAGAGRRAYVTRDDCAAAAVAVLLDAEGRRVFDIGGPEALSMDEFAAILAELSGRAVTAQDVPAAALVAGLTQGGVPEDMAKVLARFDTDGAKGYLAITAGHFEALTGRAPETVAAFLARNQQALAA